jgi:hypothetical protein
MSDNITSVFSTHYKSKILVAGLSDNFTEPNFTLSTLNFGAPNLYPSKHFEISLQELYETH